jgi:hypothetical protein
MASGFAGGFARQLELKGLDEMTFRVAMTKRKTPKGYYQVKSWLDGDRTPPMDVFLDLCDFFGCTPDELLGRSCRTVEGACGATPGAIDVPGVEE